MLQERYPEASTFIYRNVGFKIARIIEHTTLIRISSSVFGVGVYFILINQPDMQDGPQQISSRLL